MNIHSTSGRQDREDKGFTLVEILIAIVLVGILSAVAVVGISNLVSKGATSACSSSADAAKAASTVYFASNNAYPTTLTQMTTAVGAVPAALTLPTSVSINSAVSGATALPPGVAIGLQASSGTSWYMTMTPGTSNGAPTFACLP
jgi:type IV pilus assembly protein PilA